MSSSLPRGAFYFALGATLVFRLWLSAKLPVTADEAYFVLWGRRPDLGFYDHPPMIGWLLAPLVALSNADWVARLPVTVLPALTALMVRASLVRWFGKDREVADLAGLAVLLVPLNVWGVLVTTDTPLILFSVASMVLFARAAQQGSLPLFAASGAALGLAFLSKYFAVLLGVGYVAWAIASPGAPRRWSGPLAALVAAVPFGLVNLWWNVDACWCNVMFNAINRHEGAEFAVATPVLFGLSLAYLAAPLLWFAWKGRERLRDPALAALLYAWLVPLAVFLLLSPVKRIGLHWLVSFIPALIMTVAIALERRALVVTLRWFGALAVLHAAALIVLLALPLDTWKGNRLYPRLVLLFDAPAVLQALGPQLARYRLAAEGYSLAATLTHHAGRNVPVFGAGSSHARHDDIVTDWRRHDGRDFLILRRDPPALDGYRPYFREVEALQFEVRGASFHAVLGRGLHYAAYRAGVLQEVRERWYRIPPWLPVGGCYFFERYGFR